MNDAQAVEYLKPLKSPLLNISVDYSNFSPLQGLNLPPGREKPAVYGGEQRVILFLFYYVSVKGI